MKKTIVLKAQKGLLSSADLSVCIESLKMGGVIVFPTDTVYGIGCNAFHPEAIAAIYDVKGRHYSKPLPILLSNVDQLLTVAKEVPREAYRLMRAFWPGALTLVFKTAPMALHAARGKATIAVRVPDHGLVRRLLDVFELPLAATSANASGQNAYTSGRQVVRAFRGKVDVIVDGGTCAVGRESTVVDATHAPFTVLRNGAVSKEKLLEKMGLI